MVYWLDLSSSTKIYPVFHVLCLKKKVGEQVPIFSLLPPTNDVGEVLLELEAILDHCICRHGNQPLKKVLIEWHGASKENNNRESLGISRDFIHTLWKRFCKGRMLEILSHDKGGGREVFGREKCENEVFEATEGR